ncbi:MAG: alpha/beta hydrolase [Firmicutes bacterium]|nr:alpha/beta hydrolase [Bacillota bacterium]
MPISERMLEMIKKAPPLHVTGIEAARRGLTAMSCMLPKVAFSGSIKEKVITTFGQETLVRIYTPVSSGLLPLVMYMHGGGFVVGDLEYMDGACRLLAQTAGCIVVNVDYCLAPEHKFPEALEECYNALKWIYDNATDFGADAGKIAVAGDSAGANLGAAICLLARERKEFSLVYQVLFYPVVDFASDIAAKFEGLPEILLNIEDLRWMSELYFEDLNDAKKPQASPLLAESLVGLPPATVITAGIDPLAQEGRMYAERLATAGVEVFHKHFASMIHGFVGFVGRVEEANEAVVDAGKQLKKAFGC